MKPTGQSAPSNRIAVALLFTAVAGAPFLFGSVDRSVIALWCIILGLATAAGSVRGMDRRQLALAALPSLIIAGYGLVLHEQLAERPWFEVPPHAIWQQARDLLDAPIVPSVSIAHSEPLFALGAPLAALLSLISSTVVCADRRRAHQMLKVVAWSGSAYAILGIAQYALDPAKVLWVDKVAYVGSLTGTFINRNTAAVYFGSCAIVCLLLFLRRLRSVREVEGLPDHSRASAPDSGWYYVLGVDFARFFVCVAAMLMTGSRAGVVFSLVGMVIAFACLSGRHIAGWRSRGALAATAAAAAVALVVLQIVGGGVGERFNQAGLADPGRLDTYRSTVRMISDHPWLGTGLGTFALAFPPYRSDAGSVWGVWDRAHDTILEMASELGLPLVGVVVAAWIIMLAVLVHGIRVRRRDVIVPISAFAVAVISLLHAMVDFSLQTTGYAIVAFGIMGAGLAQSFGSGRRQSPWTTGANSTETHPTGRARREYAQDNASPGLVNIQDRVVNIEDSG
jgi:O-antigen ligase